MPEPAASSEQFADLRGLKCPEPLMMVRKAVRGLRGGALLHVVASDPTTLRDIPQFCRFLEHELLAQWQEGDDLHFRLRKNQRGP